MTMDLLGLDSRRHRLVALPDCPACRSVAAPSGPRALESRPMVRLSGGYRTEPAAATWARVGHHVSPITGIVAEPTPEGIADGIDALWQLPASRLAELGAEGERRVRGITWDHVIDRLTETLR